VTDTTGTEALETLTHEEEARPNVIAVSCSQGTIPRNREGLAGSLMDLTSLPEILLGRRQKTTLKESRLKLDSSNRKV
jgi:hypothetical protein